MGIANRCRPEKGGSAVTRHGIKCSEGLWYRVFLHISAQTKKKEGKENEQTEEPPVG